MGNKNEVIETLLYSTDDGDVSIDVLFENDTFWTTQKTMSNVFGVKENTITYHLKNIFNEGELNEISVTRKIRVTASDGKKYLTNFYNLDAIISVGYRVNSKQATHFRIWATNILKEYLVKGFVLDDELLKNGRKFGKDYFDELLERIREIRVSERRAYQKITDLYATSYDYNNDPQITRDFFAKVQNKVIFAVSGKTAAELILKRADSEKLYMGLTTWKGSPSSKIHASDVVVSKNYLYEDELETADRLVDGFLTTAEMRVKTHRKTEKPLLLKDWSDLLDDYIKLNRFEILNNKGEVSKKDADKIAKKEYEKYGPIQDKIYQSDYDMRLEEVDKAIKRIEGKNDTVHY
ncbi:MAG: virulence RhuM family protein [Methanobrevibacter sp.]|jgi:hypothetical protein|nr:virulence RhuM family protein [Methanobrevibacter sp.]